MDYLEYLADCSEHGQSEPMSETEYIELIEEMEAEGWH